jgi:hypothetical protein
MVIRVCWQTRKTPSLVGDSPLSVHKYYEVDRLPSTEIVVQRLKAMEMRYFDPSSVLVEQTDLDVDELQRNGEEVGKFT